MNQAPVPTDDYICDIATALKGLRMVLQSDSHDAVRPGTNEIARHSPDTADRLLLDTHWMNDDVRSAGGFHAGRDIPPRHHATLDGYFDVFSDRGTFWIGHSENGWEFSPRPRLFLRRGTIRVLPPIIEASAVVRLAGTTRWDPRDILLVDAADRRPESFIRPPRSAQQ